MLLFTLLTQTAEQESLTFPHLLLSFRLSLSCKPDLQLSPSAHSSPDFASSQIFSFSSHNDCTMMATCCRISIFLLCIHVVFLITTASHPPPDSASKRKYDPIRFYSSGKNETRISLSKTGDSAHIGSDKINRLYMDRPLELNYKLILQSQKIEETVVPLRFGSYCKSNESQSDVCPLHEYDWKTGTENGTIQIMRKTNTTVVLMTNSSSAGIHNQTIDLKENPSTGLLIWIDVTSVPETLMLQILPDDDFEKETKVMRERTENERFKEMIVQKCGPIDRSEREDGMPCPLDTCPIEVCLMIHLGLYASQLEQSIRTSGFS